MSSIRQAPGADKAACDCSCSGGGCAVTITGKLRGCNSGNLSGVTVEAHDATSGGTLLGTATTNGTGDYSISVTGAIAGHAIVVVPLGLTRFNSPNRTLSWTGVPPPGNTEWACTYTTSMGTIVYTAASGYTCIGSCTYPLPNTLTLTDSTYGTCTLTHAAGGWSGSLSATFAGSTNPPCPDTCAGSAVTIAYSWDGSTLNSGLAVNVGSGVGSCPGGTPTLGGNPTGGGFTIVCPFSFSATISASVSQWSTNRLANLYCAGVTITIVE